MKIHIASIVGVVFVACIVSLPAVETAAASTTAECCYTGKGENYKGSESITETNEPCIAWEIASYYNTETANYCRNPDGDSKPWCYTDTHANYKHCSVPKCTGKANQVKDCLLETTEATPTEEPTTPTATEAPTEEPTTPTATEAPTEEPTTPTATEAPTAESTKELGEVCDTLGNQCKDENVECRDTMRTKENGEKLYKCWCKDGYANNNDDGCVALDTLELGDSCKKHNKGEPCKAKNSLCMGGKNPKCKCTKRFKRNGNKCESKSG